MFCCSAVFFCCLFQEFKETVLLVSRIQRKFLFCLFVSRKEGFVSRTRRNGAVLLLLVSRTAQRKEERTGFVSQGRGFVYLFQEWFVPKKKTRCLCLSRKPGFVYLFQEWGLFPRRRKNRCCSTTAQRHNGTTNNGTTAQLTTAQRHNVVLLLVLLLVVLLVEENNTWFFFWLKKTTPGCSSGCSSG